MRDTVIGIRVASGALAQLSALRKWFAAILIASGVAGGAVFAAATQFGPVQPVTEHHSDIDGRSESVVPNHARAAPVSELGPEKLRRSFVPSGPALIAGMAMAITFLAGALAALLYELLIPRRMPDATRTVTPMSNQMGRSTGSRAGRGSDYPASLDDARWNEDRDLEQNAVLNCTTQQRRKMTRSFGDIVSVAERLSEVRNGRLAVRTLIVGTHGHIDGRPDAEFLARQLAKQSDYVLLIDWALQKEAAGIRPARAQIPGISSLLSGRATFEDVISVLPGSKAHLIAATGDASGDGAANPDVLNLILDSLDDAYDHVVVTGPLEDCRLLFETIEGRFDACVAVSPPGQSVAQSQRLHGTTGFLGFDVSGIELFEVQHSPAGRLDTEQETAPQPGAA